MRNLLFFIALIFSTSLLGQNGKVIEEGGGSGWLKDSLQAGRVSIDAPGNTLSLTSLDSFRVRAEEILLRASSTMNIKMDSANANNEIVFNNRFTVDGDGVIELWSLEDSFDPGYIATDNGKMAYNNTTNVPMFRNTSQWVDLATADQITAPDGAPHTIQDEGVSLPQETVLNFVGAGVTATDGAGETIVTIPGATSTASYAELNGSSINFSITTTQTNFTSTGFQLDDYVSADWSLDAANDEVDYSGDNGVIFMVHYHATGTIGSGALKEISMVVEKNNATVDGSESTQLVSATNDEGVTFSGTVLVSMSSGDSLNLAMSCTTTTAEFDCDNMSLVVTKLVGQ